MANVQIQGVGELIGKVKNLDSALQSRGIRRALTESGKPVLAQDRATVPVDTGLLRQSLANKTVSLKRGQYALLTGARHFHSTKKHKGFKAIKRVRRSILRKKWGGLESVDPARYLHLVEIGHAVRVKRGSTIQRILGRLRRYVGHRNRVAGRHSLELGLKAAAPQAEAAMANSLKQFIETTAANAAPTG